MYSSTDEISGAKMLSPGVPPEERALEAEKLERLRNELESLEPKLKEAEEAFLKTQTSAQIATGKLNDTKKAKTQLGDAKNKVERAKRSLENAENDANKDDSAEKKKLAKSICSNTENFLKYLSVAGTKFEEMLNASTALTGIKMSTEGLDTRIRLLK